MPSTTETLAILRAAIAGVSSATAKGKRDDGSSKEIRGDNAARCANIPPMRKIQIVLTRLVAVFAVAAGLAGCAQADAVRMVNVRTGQTAQCGPYYVRGLDGATAATMQQERCISDYQ